MGDILPSVNPEEVLDTVNQLKKQGFSWENVLYIAGLFLVCLVVMKILMAFLNRALDRLGVEKGIHTFVKSIARIFLWVLTLAIVLGSMGIPVTSLIAVFSVAGLAISLAIQGTLSNLAGGIMILVTKPFKAGDFVETESMSGLVSEIGLVYTKVKTYDNKLVMMPNGQLSAAKITNYTAEENRRVDLKFHVSYDAPMEKVKAAIQGVIGVHPKALFTPAPFVRVSAFGESSVEYAVRVWCATADYWELYADLLEQVKTAFDAEGIEMTYNHVNVHILHSDGGKPTDHG